MRSRQRARPAPAAGRPVGAQSRAALAGAPRAYRPEAARSASRVSTTQFRSQSSCGVSNMRAGQTALRCNGEVDERVGLSLNIQSATRTARAGEDRGELLATQER